MLNEICTQQHFEHIESLTYHLLIQTQWYLSFCYHADMATKGLGLWLGFAKVEVLLNTIGFYLQ
jgi:hypothetical protein